MKFQCGLSLEFQRVVIIFITLSQPLHPEMFSKLRPVLGGHNINEKTENEENVSFKLEVVLLENLDMSMTSTDKDQPPFMECLDSRTSLSQPKENDVNTGGPAQARLLRNQVLASPSNPSPISRPVLV